MKDKSTKNSAKTYSGTAIYQPTGRAAEYASWACNFFTGCSNNCEYCYCKKGYLKRLWTKKPRLKKCFRSEDAALEAFKREAARNKGELRKAGLFFSFTTDPLLPDTFPLTLAAAQWAVAAGIPVKILSKTARELFRNWSVFRTSFNGWEDCIAVGFTLTGRDDLEHGCDSNRQRLDAIRTLGQEGYQTFASIEPIVDFDRSMEMSKAAIDAGCGLLLCGGLTGTYDFGTARSGMEAFSFIKELGGIADAAGIKVYVKDSLLTLAGIDRDSLQGLNGCFVDGDYNMFKEAQEDYQWLHPA